MASLILIGEQGNGSAPPSAQLAGAKAAALARVAALGLRVPPAFVLPTPLCAPVLAERPGALVELRESLKTGLAYLERRTGLIFGDRRRPLLLSVRSGAAVSMPGMLDTVLNVGCTRTAVRGLMRWRGKPRFDRDCRRRLIEGYAHTVLGVDPRLLEARLAAAVAAEQAATDADLDGEALERLCAAYEMEVAAQDEAVPEDPFEQLLSSAKAVFASWGSERATAYRRLRGLDDLQGSAVAVQAMVFGNADQRSAAGVAFSRNPSTGAPEPVIEALFAGQGEDVVSGRRSPASQAMLAEREPAAAAELHGVLRTLEAAFGDLQDVEFTIESGVLHILQTRAAKRTPRAALRIALDLAEAGVISPPEALSRVQALAPESLAVTRFADEAEAIALGEPAAPGVASGRAVLDSHTARSWAGEADPVILVRHDTSTEDVVGFDAAAAILTARGGRTAHAALVALQMNKPCVVGCAGLEIDLAARRFRLGGRTLAEGDWLSVDGDSGQVFAGRRKIVRQAPAADLERLARLRKESAAPSSCASAPAVSSAGTARPRP